MPYWTEEERSFLIKSYGKIETRSIAKKLNRSPETVRAQALSLGLSKKKIDFKLAVGAVFGRWTVIRETNNKSSDGSNKYLCRCECGNQKEVRRASLVNRDSRSCGCLASERIRETHSLPDGETSFNSLYTTCKRSAKRASGNRILEFSLTRQEHRDIITQDCHYCGSIPKKFSRYESRIKSDKKNKVKIAITDIAVDRSWIYVNTVDRVDSDKGYTVDNCIPCCWPCNFMKMDRAEKEFLDQVEKIHKFQKRKNK